MSSDEDTKYGVPKEDVLNLVEFIEKLCPRLKFRGLMTIGKVNDIEGFQIMHDLKERLCDQYPKLKEEFILSMGTSADFETAIVEGANEVRVGTILFGERDYSKKNKPDG